MGDYIGEYLESDLKNYSVIWKEYMRIWVRMDIPKPIRRKIQIKKLKGEWIWIDFKYEKISMFCYFLEL